MNKKEKKQLIGHNLSNVIPAPVGKNSNKTAIISPANDFGSLTDKLKQQNKLSSRKHIFKPTLPTDF